MFAEVVNEMRDRREPVEVATWLDVADVFSVRADDDPEWAVLTFRPGAGPRSLIVRGTAEAVALVIGAEKDRQRRPARRMRAL